MSPGRHGSVGVMAADNRLFVEAGSIATQPASPLAVVMVCHIDILVVLSRCDELSAGARRC